MEGGQAVVEQGYEEALRAFDKSLERFKRLYYNKTDESNNQDLNIIKVMEKRFHDLYKTLMIILDKKGDINLIPKDNMEVYTVYQLFEKNGNVFSILAKSGSDDLSHRMRLMAQGHLLYYTNTPNSEHITDMSKAGVEASKTFVENK